MRSYKHTQTFLITTAVMAIAMLPNKSYSRQVSYGYHTSFQIAQSYTMPSYPARSPRYNNNPYYNNSYYRALQRSYAPRHYDNTGPRYFYYSNPYYSN